MRKLNLNKLKNRKRITVPSGKALKDVVPMNWNIKFEDFLTEHKEEIKEIVSKNPTAISREELNDEWKDGMIKLNKNDESDVEWVNED